MVTSRGIKIRRGNGVFAVPVICCVFLTMFLVSLVISSEVFQPQVNRSNASDVGVSANISPVAVLKVPVTFVDMGEAKVASGDLTTKDFKTYVSTNNQTGYTLSVNTKNSIQCLRRPENQGTVCASIQERNRIMPLAATTATASFPMNFWGLSADEFFESYSPVPYSLSTAWKFKTTDSSAIDDETTIRAGVKVDLTKAPGVYSNDIVISVVVNPLPVPIITAIDPKPTVGTQTTMAYGFPGDEIQMTGVYLDLLSRVELAGNVCENLDKVSETFATCDVPNGSGYNLRLTSVSMFGGTNLNAPFFGYQEDFRFTIDTRMTDTLFAEGDTIDTNPAHFSGTDTLFTIPAVSCDSYYSTGSLCYTSSNYYWRIDWGDGSPIEHATGSGTGGGGGLPTIGASIPHTYPAPGEYQIRIMSEGAASGSWFNRFGLGNGGTQANKNMVKSIDTPLPRLTGGLMYQMFSGLKNAYSLPADLFRNYKPTSFYYMFAQYAYNNTSGIIPNGLLSGVTTISTGNTMNARGFNNTFAQYAYNSTIGTIPEDLFRDLNSSSITTLYYAFGSTFAQCMYSSTVGTIPEDLFSSINTSNVTVMYYAFAATFYNYAYNSTIGEIPAGLFRSFDTSKVTSFERTFENAFVGFAYNSASGTIPAGLFDTINTSSATNVYGLFSNTFSNYAYNSTVGTIPAGLFDKIRLNPGASITVDNMFNSTFVGYAYMNTTTMTDINSIWGGANFGGKITTANAQNVFNQTFRNMRSLTGAAQTFINNYVGGVNPASRAYTFDGTSVTDLASLPTNWR